MKPRIYIYVALVSALFFFSPLVKAQVDSGAMVVSAVEYIESGDYIRAEAVLQRILSEDPDNDAALYYMAMCHLAQKRADKAEDCLNAAVASDSTNFWYRHRLASLARQDGDDTRNLWNPMRLRHSGSPRPCPHASGQGGTWPCNKGLHRCPDLPRESSAAPLPP